MLCPEEKQIKKMAGKNAAETQKNQGSEGRDANPAIFA
jgi:hypothetical protein